MPAMDGRQRLSTGDAPWESYVTDPGEVPDVKDWRTEVYWPLEKSADA